MVVCAAGILFIVISLGASYLGKEESKKSPGIVALSFFGLSASVACCACRCTVAPQACRTREGRRENNRNFVPVNGTLVVGVRTSCHHREKTFRYRTGGVFDGLDCVYACLGLAIHENEVSTYIAKMASPVFCVGLRWQSLFYDLLQHHRSVRILVQLLKSPVCYFADRLVFCLLQPRDPDEASQPLLGAIP